MFAVSVELLAGRYVATAYNDRESVEWPPHPARLFSALVSTWAEGDPGSEESKAELAALNWLEQQSPPDILASGQARAGRRDVVTVFVPVNDTAVVSPPDADKLYAAEAALSTASEPRTVAKAERDMEKLRQKLFDDTSKAVAAPTRFGKGDAVAGRRAFAEGRPRQPRTFPSATPECPTVAFVWPDAEASATVRQALQRLVARLVRLGHSSTLVHASIAEAPSIDALEVNAMRYRPDESAGDLVVRWVNEGQTARLARAFAHHRETEPRVLPARFVRYREGDVGAMENMTIQSVFSDELIVFARVGGPRLPITASAGVARQLRRALMSSADQPVHEMLSGHQPDGSASETPHLAVVPLPVVSGPHADGALIGVGLILPRGCDPQAREAVMRAIGRLESAGPSDGPDAPVVFLKLGSAGVLELQRVVWGEDRRTTLQAATWTRRSRRWASATPVALDRNPGDLHDADPQRRQAAFVAATETVVSAVRRIGLPDPTAVDVLRSCVVPGSAKPLLYPRYPDEAARPQRVLVHVRLVFADPITGPVLLGAGRYHGLGLCVPLDAEVSR